MQVAEGIHRLTGGVCNFYLIEDGGKLVLVDAGAPRDWDLLVRTLATLGHRLEDLEAVLLTHAHSDHTGFAERARTTAGVPVWIHQIDAAVVKGATPGKNDGKARSYLLRMEFYRTLFSLARRGATKLIPIREVSTFADGETLEVPGRRAGRACPWTHTGMCGAAAGGAGGAAERRRAGDEEPAHRPGRPADHAVGSQPRHPAGAAIAGHTGRDPGCRASTGPWRALDRGGGRGRAAGASGRPL